MAGVGRKLLFLFILMASLSPLSTQAADLLFFISYGPPPGETPSGDAKGQYPLRTKAQSLVQSLRIQEGHKAYLSLSHSLPLLFSSPYFLSPLYHEKLVTSGFYLQAELVGERIQLALEVRAQERDWQGKTQSLHTALNVPAGQWIQISGADQNPEIVKNTDQGTFITTAGPDKQSGNIFIKVEKLAQ